jgi:hypothetical protein
MERRPNRMSKMEELYRKLEPELRRTKPNPEAIAAALEAAQRLVTEVDLRISQSRRKQVLRHVRSGNGLGGRGAGGALPHA